MKKKMSFINWIKKGENWIPFTVFAGILTAIALSWLTIFFVEYGPYFDRSYQESLFSGYVWNGSGKRNDDVIIDIDGNRYWTLRATVDFDGNSSYGSRVISQEENGNGVAYKIEGGDTAMYSYNIADNEWSEKKAVPLISANEFASMCISIDLPVSGMSFKAKMDNISVFKKDNALVSNAYMPSDKAYTLSVVGWDKSKTLTNVSLYSYTYPWAEMPEGVCKSGCSISGYCEGSLIEVRWMFSWTHK